MARAKRGFTINLAFFLAVNLMILAVWAVLQAVGAIWTGQIWPYPVVMGLWLAYILYQRYRAYHEPTYPEEQIQRELKKLS